METINFQMRFIASILLTPDSEDILKSVTVCYLPVATSSYMAHGNKEEFFHYPLKMRTAVETRLSTDF